MVRSFSTIARCWTNPAEVSKEVVTKVLDPNETAPIFHDDVTVEVSTPRDDRMIKLRPGRPVVHKYVLYNGPVKVRLLDHQIAGGSARGFGHGQLLHGRSAPGHADRLSVQLDGALVQRHRRDATGRLVHQPHARRALVDLQRCEVHLGPEILVYGICILLLTVLVRGIMHPLSRKQARTTLRMQALQPELVKLKEKYKDDRQALQVAAWSCIASTASIRWVAAG